jgi:lysophospholipase L1-like esterase
MTRRTVAAAALVLSGIAIACAPAASPSPLVSTAPTGSPSPSAAPTPTTAPTSSPTPAATAAAGQLAGTYLALGDSLAVGAGASDRGTLGYVGRLAAALSGSGRTPGTPPVAALRNLAVGGETSGSMIDRGQLADAVAAIGAADPPVTFVSLDIGGNDLLRLIRTEPCTSAPQSDGCLALVATALDSYAANARRILGELRAALDGVAPDATLSVMTYFNPFSGTGASYEQAGELALLGADRRLDCAAAIEDPRQRGMNDVIACVAAEHGAVLVDVQPAFVGAGLELTHIGSEDIHANDVGYAVIAEAFLDALAAAAAAAD